MIVAAIDTDFLNKGVCYGLMADLILVIPAASTDVGVLPFAKYVVRKLIRRTLSPERQEEALVRLDSVLVAAQSLEPTTDEARYAADLEYAAQEAKVDLDTGESILAAIVVMRGTPAFVTGDKRAIRALEVVLARRGESDRLRDRVAGLENLVHRLLTRGKAADIRTAICREPQIDGSLTQCFSCKSNEVGPESWSEGLLSQINHLRGTAPSIMMRG
jgi:hypothetical protein